MRLKSKRAAWVVIALLTAILAAPLQAAAPEIASNAAILLDYRTGQILYEYNADEPLAPASITKVMTLYLAFDALKAGKISLDKICIVSERAYEIGESTMWLNRGDRVRFEEIIKGVAIASGNDATVVVAEEIGGSVESFVAMMNDKAKELGLSQTHFVNTHGLDEDGHLMSARDTIMLGYHLITEHPEALQYTDVPSMFYAGVELKSANDLLELYEGTDGIKTGSTDNAGYSLMATVEREGVRLISVVMGTPSPLVRSNQSMKLLDYGFGKDFERRNAVEKGTVLEEKLNVRRADLDQIKLEIGASVPVVIDLEHEDEVEIALDIPEQLDAPVHRGDEVGNLKVSYHGQEIGEVPILAAEDSGEANFFKALWQSVVEFFSGLVRIV